MKKAFTLIELLCVLAISALLIVLISKTLVINLRWVEDDHEQDVLSAQMNQALDLIESDVRAARDINSAYFSRIYDLAKVSETVELRLLCPDSGGTAAAGNIAYTTAIGDSAALTAYRKSPLQLYRSERDSVHDGVNQPVALYLNSMQSSPKGFRVHYYNQSGEACTLADDIYSIEVCMAATTNHGIKVEKLRRMPLSGKYYKEG